MKITDSKNGKLVLSAMFVTLGMILPFLTGQIKQIGNMLLPMHLPIMLCGLICGPWYGLAAGFLTPLLRSAVFGMPHLFPSAAAMAFELGAYGSVIGFLYNRSKWKCLVALLRSMVIAMLCGRAVWGLAMALFMGFSGDNFTWQAFLAGALLNAVPGIVLQFILIPSIMILLGRTKAIVLSKKKGNLTAHEK